MVSAGAGTVAEDRDGGAKAAVIAERFFEHARSDFRNGLHAVALVLRLDKIRILIRKRAAFNGRAAVIREIF